MTKVVGPRQAHPIDAGVEEPAVVRRRIRQAEHLRPIGSGHRLERDAMSRPSRASGPTVVFQLNGPVGRFRWAPAPWSDASRRCRSRPPGSRVDPPIGTDSERDHAGRHRRRAPGARRARDEAKIPRVASVPTEVLGGRPLAVSQRRSHESGPSHTRHHGGTEHDRAGIPQSPHADVVLGGHP